ncbi:hypothetical protein L226DRAFT_328163 [Lentinus tigrinus ALCF2SS1-7]|uniref:uncharacterized protein n=1 Tax=Lentinus tigrinus ALCF2SS1-7 TaxID=1328758 RepID=UPI001165F661|nr:hypothetical protein L226DRAFT_328163 [Lentinus tigrinus ALCF2SS1-7]
MAIRTLFLFGPCDGYGAHARCHQITTLHPARACCVLCPYGIAALRLRNSAPPPQARGQGRQSGESLGLRGNSADRVSSPHVHVPPATAPERDPRSAFCICICICDIIYPFRIRCGLPDVPIQCDYQKVAQKGCWRLLGSPDVGGEFAGKHVAVRHVLHMSANATGSSLTELEKLELVAARQVTLNTSTSRGRGAQGGSDTFHRPCRRSQSTGGSRFAVRSSQLPSPRCPVAVPEDEARGDALSLVQSESRRVVAQNPLGPETRL